MSSARGGAPGPDASFMAQALALGALGEGTTSPNPRVGCVVVREDRVVGCGFHVAAGAPHAEALALAEAGAAARGATVYVTLEPCAHQGRTPPCTDLLVAAGVRRVVAAMQDPNPLVDGRGFERLLAAGIAVETGLGSGDARALNEPFVHWHATGRPLVTLKAALSLDGMLAAAGGRSRWITGEAARRFAHRLRLRHDAILVGAETVRRDDPALTVRLPGVAVDRRRVVVSTAGDLDPRARLFATGGGVVYVASSALERAARRLGDRAEVVGLPAGPGGVDLRAMLEHLGRKGVQSLLVEGGGRTHAGLLAAGLADRGAVFSSGRLLGASGSTPWLPDFGVAEPASAPRLRARTLLPLGEDWVVLGPIEQAR